MSINKIRNAYRGMTNTIRKKFFISFIIIMAFMSLITVYTLISGKQTNDRYDAMVEKMLLVNDVYVSIDNTNALFQRYMEYFLPEDRRTYTENCAELIEKEHKLDALDSFGYEREIVDFRHMIESYTEYADKAVQIKSDYGTQGTNVAYLAKLNLFYNQSQSVYGIMNRNFKSVYSITLSDAKGIRAHIEKSTRLVYAIDIILLVFVIVNCIVFFNFLSENLTKPIQTLTYFASCISTGDMLLVPPEVKSNDEVRILSKAFDNMLGRIRQQIAEIRENAKMKDQLLAVEVKNLQVSNMLKLTELKVLQSRINPHFLFNTLNMISQTAYIEEADKTVSLIDTTASLLRYNLDKLTKAVTLDDEIHNVEDYVFIQRQRFGNRILFRFDVDSSLGAIKLPCLILQPLVENSIIHGFGTLIDGGLITLRTARDGEYVVLSVSDNGVGIPSGKLEPLLSYLSRLDIEPSDELGLKNVQMRLHLFFNGDVTVFVSSAPRDRTEVSLRIPFLP